MKLDVMIPCTRADKLERLVQSIKDQKIEGTRINVWIDDDKNYKEINKASKGASHIAFDPSRKEPQGASVARNRAFRMTLENEETDGPGDYLLFIDDDCILMPGVIQNMIDIMDGDSGISFVYGDYEFDSGKIFKSRKFNPYVLRTHNYIPTMSLMRREVYEKVGGFNENLAFFQDWAFFYQAAKKKFVGKYLPEIIFKTSDPNEDSISGIKMSLAEKAKIWRKENKVKDSELVVTTFAAQLQAEQRAEMLNADYAGIMSNGSGVFPNNLRYDNWKYSYMIGSFNHPTTALINHMNAMVGHKIMHFIGTDVFQLREKHPWVKIQLMKDELVRRKIKILSNSEVLNNELNQIGIENKLVYTPIYEMDRFQPTVLPEDFTVAVYYSDTPNMNFLDVRNDPLNNNNGESNMYLVWEVAKALPHIKFKFFGGPAKFKTENVEFCGRIPSDKMPEFINSCSMVLRCTVHDGFPQLPIQFLLSGRNALVTYQGKDLKYADKLSFTDILHYENCKNEIIDGIGVCRENPNGFQYTALIRQYYSELLSVKKYNEEIKNVMKEFKNGKK